MIKLQSEECVPASPRAHPGSPSPPPPPPPFTSSHNLYFHTCSVCTQEPKSKQTFGAPLCDRHMNMLFQKLYFAWCYCTFFISGITCWFLLKPERRHIFNLSSVSSNVSLQHFSIISWTKYFWLQLSQKGGQTFCKFQKIYLNLYYTYVFIRWAVGRRSFTYIWHFWIVLSSLSSTDRLKQDGDRQWREPCHNDFLWYPPPLSI